VLVAVNGNCQTKPYLKGGRLWVLHLIGDTLPKFFVRFFGKQFHAVCGLGELNFRDLTPSQHR